jgi:hypothetical protein
MLCGRVRQGQRETGPKSKDSREKIEKQAKYCESFLFILRIEIKSSLQTKTPAAAKTAGILE